MTLLHPHPTLLLYRRCGGAWAGWTYIVHTHHTPLGVVLGGMQVCDPLQAAMAGALRVGMHMSWGLGWRWHHDQVSLECEGWAAEEGWSELASGSLVDLTRRSGKTGL